MSKRANNLPIMKGLHPNSTTVTAYCPNCNAPIQHVLQEKCNECDLKLNWDSFSLFSKSFSDVKKGES